MSVRGNCAGSNIRFGCSRCAAAAGYIASRSDGHSQERRFHSAVPMIISGVILCVLAEVSSHLLYLQIVLILAVGFMLKMPTPLISSYLTEIMPLKKCCAGRWGGGGGLDSSLARCSWGTRSRFRRVSALPSLPSASPASSAVWFFSQCVRMRQTAPSRRAFSSRAKGNNTSRATDLDGTKMETEGNFGGWIDRTEIQTQRIDAMPVTALALALDLSADDMDRSTLPTGWQLLYFNPVARRSAPGEVGHPRRYLSNSFLPPFWLLRRMGLAAASATLMRCLLAARRCGRVEYCAL